MRGWSARIISGVAIGRRPFHLIKDTESTEVEQTPSGPARNVKAERFDGGAAERRGWSEGFDQKNESHRLVLGDSFF